MDATKFECSICCNLLVDPVVGKCGHDFCKECLNSWRASQWAHGRPFACPLCRAVLSEHNLGVCVRLRETVELLFPEKVAERKCELQRRQDQARQRSREEERPGHVAASVSTLIENARQGRRSYLRARRTRPPHPPMALGAAGAHPTAFASFTFSSGGQATPANMQLNWTMNGMQFPASSGFGAGPLSPAIAGQGHWVAPPVSFTMGWYDPNEVRNKRGSRRRRVGS